MSIRSFVTLCSLLLIGWLAIAFVHVPRLRQMPQPVAEEAGSESTDELAAVEDMAVSVSP